MDRYELWMRSLRVVARAMSASGYRLSIEGREHVPEAGPAIVVANHVAMHDWMFVGIALPRPPRFVMHQHHFQYPLLRAFFQASRVIAIAPRKQDPARLEVALEEIDRALEGGELVVISPEGSMTPDGSLGPIRPGIERIVARRPVPVIPIGIDGLYGSFLSRAHGAPGSTRPSLARRRVTLRIGRAIAPHEVSCESIRAQLLALTRRGEGAAGVARARV